MIEGWTFQHLPNPIWCEHFKNKNIWSNPPFGAVRFRTRGAFCNWLWLGRCGHWLTAFSRPFTPSTTIPRLTPFSTLMLRLYRAFFPIRQQTKPKINQFCEDHLAVFTREQVRLSSEIPCLNTQVLFSFGGETCFESFLFSLTVSSNNCVVLSAFWGEWTCSIRFGNAKSYFCEMIFGRNWPLSLDQITKRQSSLKVCFFILPKSPIRARLIGQIHFLKMSKPHCSKRRITPNIFIFIWETLHNVSQIENRVFTICRIFWFISAFGKICFQHFQKLNLSDRPHFDWAFGQENKTDFESWLSIYDLVQRERPISSEYHFAKIRLGVPKSDWTSSFSSKRGQNQHKFLKKLSTRKGNL